MPRLKDKVALVTGGALGIGRESCLALAREGAAVAVTDVKTDEIEEVAATIGDEGGTAAAWELDVSDEEQVQKVFAAVVEEFGRLDVVVNNAGIAGPNKPTHEIEPEEWDQLMAVNVRGVYLCTRAAIPHLRSAGGGSIINLSSVFVMSRTAPFDAW